MGGGGTTTMTWASSVITGVQELFGLCPTSSKEPPSPAKRPDRGSWKKGDTSKMVKPEKWARGAGDDFAAILHDSNTCQGASLGPPTTCMLS